MAEPSKNSIMKMLLSAANPSKKHIATALSMDTTLKKCEEERTTKLSTYLQQLSGQFDRLNSVDLDHSYSLPWNWRPDNSYAKPVKTLFLPKSPHILENRLNLDSVDPDEDKATPKPAYDEEKAKQYMLETEKNLKLIKPDPGDPEWESKIDRSGWSTRQGRIFDRMVRILNNDRLARLTYQGTWNEPALRRISINKTARRLRSLFNAFSWQEQLIQWLHVLLLDNLDTTSLASYIDMLQVLKSKVPQLVERILSLPPSISCKNFNPDSLNALIKTPWDPFSSSLACHAPERLPGNPLIVLVPNSPGTNTMYNRRIQRWYHHLSMIGQVVIVTTNNLQNTRVSMVTSLEHMMAATRGKLNELRADFVGRSIILVGFNAGAALACQVALLEHVTAVVCLGFPVNTVEEKRGQPDDALLSLSVPVLFVIGQHAATANVDDVEDLRERLRTESGLVVVGAADDHLRISKAKQSAEGITQSMVDRCIVDEVADFVGTILLAPAPTARVETRPRAKVTENKKRKTPDESLPRKTMLQTVATQDATPVKRVRLPVAKATRTKWKPQTPAGGDSLADLSRRTGLSQEEILAATRQSLETISVGGFKRIIMDGLDNETFKIMPQIKVLGSEECEGFAGNNSFVDTLTPDRLLEMPIIIAQEDGTDTVI